MIGLQAILVNKKQKEGKIEAKLYFQIQECLRVASHKGVFFLNSTDKCLGPFTARSYHRFKFLGVANCTRGKLDVWFGDRPVIENGFRNVEDSQGLSNCQEY